MGDFNEIMYSFEKRGGKLCKVGNMVRFHESLNVYGLIDIGFTGKWFTWEKGRLPENNIQERIDKGVANQAW